MIQLRFCLILAVLVIPTANVSLQGTDDSAKTTDDPWEPIRYFLGKWKGTGKGLGGDSVVEHSYELILQEKFIHTRTRSVFQPQENETSEEVHEDWGFFSYDSDRDLTIFRQFLTEGFVNTYVLDDASNASSLIFSSESAEGAGGTKARLTYNIINDSEYVLRLELAPPGKEYFACRNLRMQRVDKFEGLAPATIENQEGLTMINGSHSVIYSTDPAADRAFLRDVLELPNVDVGDGWLIFGLPPAEVAVHPSNENDVHEFYLMCDDVEAFVAEMKKHNIECSPVQNLAWGWLTQVKLPGGGSLGIYQPRHARPEAMDGARGKKTPAKG